MKVLIDIDEEYYNYAKQQVADGITNPFKIFIASGTPIPDNATNGDVIKAMFPTADISLNDSCFEGVVNKYGFDMNWWNSPYQKGSKERDYDAEYRNHSEMILNAQKARDKE